VANEGIPVNKELISWARKRAGLTLAEAAEKFAQIAAWEEGASSPSYPQSPCASPEACKRGTGLDTAREVAGAGTIVNQCKREGGFRAALFTAGVQSDA
jgi:hypothetical protein